MKMTHMTRSVYDLTQILGKLVGVDLNLCVYNYYNAAKKERINMHSDTQTKNPKEIAHAQNTPVVSITIKGEMNFNVHANRLDTLKAMRKLKRIDFTDKEVKDMESFPCNYADSHDPTYNFQPSTTADTNLTQDTAIGKV